MNETPIFIDGKLKFVVPGEILRTVVIPGKLVNFITKQPDKQHYITCTQGIKNGKRFKRYTFGSMVKKKTRDLFKELKP